MGLAKTIDCRANVRVGVFVLKVSGILNLKVGWGILAGKRKSPPWGRAALN